MIDPDTNEVDEVYKVSVTKDMIFISLTEKGTTSEYGYMNTDKGLVSFDVLKEGDKVIFEGREKAVEGKKVVDVLVDFKMSSAFFNYKDGAFTLVLGQGFGEYLDNFLPSAIIKENGTSIDEETFVMKIEDNKMTVDMIILMDYGTLI